jgi:outer membrane protein assembly factor BamB
MTGGNMRQIISGVLIMFLAFGLLSCTSFTLAPGSYFTTNSISFGHFKSSLPDIEYKLAEVPEFPEGSIYKPTDDFELITENLPKPAITRNYIEDFEFIPWTQKTYDATEKLEKVWGYELNESEIPKDDRWIGGCSTALKEWYIRYSYDAGEIPETYQVKYLNPVDGSDVSRCSIKKNPLYNYFCTFDTINEILIYDKKMTVYMDNFYGDTIWSFNYKSKIDRDYISYLCVVEDSLIFRTKDRLLCVDPSTGTVKWILNNTKKTRLYAYYECAGFIWAIFDKGRGHMASNPVFYRINPISLDIVEVDIDHISAVFHYIFEYNNSVYYTLYDDPKLYELDIETGLIINTYELPESFEYWGGHWSNDDSPLILQHMNKPLDKVFFYDIKNDSLELIADYPDISSDTLLWSNFNFRFRNKISRNKTEMGFDENYFFGFDVKTGERTWSINREDAGEDAIIQLVDHNGVLISNGSVISCYRVP